MKRFWLIFIDFIGPISSLLGIVGVTILDLVKDETKTWIVFSLTLALIFFGFVRVYLMTSKAMKKRYPQGFLPIATFARYSTSDGKRVQYELFRHIQVKQPFMSEFEHKFVWSGSQTPTITSNIQTIKNNGEIMDNEMDDGEKGKKVILEFKESLLYNSCEVIHLLMDIDDSDQKSKPFLSQNVKEPVKSIHFRVELLHADSNYHHKKAVLEYYNLSKPKATPCKLREVSFDPVSKCYSDLVVNPKAGYCYKLSWEKPI